MVTRVPTEERPLETPSSEESGLGQSCNTPDDSEPEAALVVPPDGGWGWVVMVASFFCNFVIDGLIFTGSAITKEIKDDLKVGEVEVGWVSSLLIGVYLMAGPFVSALANKYGFRVVTIAGSIIGCIAFSVCYFLKSVVSLYFVYGIIGGFGFCMVYMSSVLTVGFYFEKWRALATGVALCGSGVGTFALKPLNDYLIITLGWRKTLVTQGVMLLTCAICGAMFRPIKPTRVTLSDQQNEEEDSSKRHEEAVEKLNSMLKLQTKLDSGISMVPEMRFNRSTPHTWMGVANNTRYPTVEEVFKGSGSHLSRRSSATAGTIKNHMNKPMFITVPVAEKDEDDSNTSIDNTEPLISTHIKIMPKIEKPRRSTADLVARPMYRDDIFFSASLSRLPQYTSRTSLGYHLAVTHIPTQEDEQEEKSCRLCPEAIRRTLATMLDVSLFRSPTVMTLAISGFLTMLGFFIPYQHMQSRAVNVGNMEVSIAAMLIPVIGIANTISRIGSGYISSIPNVSILWLNNLALSAGGIALMLSGLSYHAAYQFGVCVVFGLAAACFSSLRSILVVEYIGLEQLTNVFGIFLLFQGCGALFGIPLAAGLLEITGHNYNIAFYVSGGFILLSALITYPLDKISRWEKERNKLSGPKV